MKVENIAHSLNISVGKAYEIILKDLGYPKVSCRWVPKMLTQEHRQKSEELSQTDLETGRAFPVGLGSGSGLSSKKFLGRFRACFVMFILLLHLYSLLRSFMHFQVVGEI